jgi:hypothetical protein
MEAGRIALQPFATLPPAGAAGWPSYATRTLAALAGVLVSPKHGGATRRQRYEANPHAVV